MLILRPFQIKEWHFAVFIGKLFNKIHPIREFASLASYGKKNGFRIKKQKNEKTAR
jgi:hypothetical protein